MSVITALIPARSGSKSIPGKNTMLLDGVPLIAHSIRHALESCLIDKVVVSTDCEQIKMIAESFGAMVPFLRPDSLATDECLDFPVFRHYLDFASQSKEGLPDILVHLRPTAPYRSKGLIDACIRKLLHNPNATSVRTISRTRVHPYRMYYRSAGDILLPVVKNEYPWPDELRRQDLLPVYEYNCCVDVVHCSTILRENSMTGSRMLGYLMEKAPLDIDEPEDLYGTRG